MLSSQACCMLNFHHYPNSLSSSKLNLFSIFSFLIYNFILFFFVVLHSIRLTHTDLKPENMLFVNSDYDVYWNENLVCLILSDLMELI